MGSKIMAVIRQYIAMEKAKKFIARYVPKPASKDDVYKLASIAACVGYRVEDYDRIVRGGE